MRSSALRRRKRVRRTMTSIWWSIQCVMKPSSGSVRGTPSTIASMFAPKFSCSCVCLYRLFSTTLATASRFSTITRRWPVRPEDSSRMSAMPVILPSRARSLILTATLSGLTWYGSSVMTRHVRPCTSSTLTTARIVIEPRPVRYASLMPRVPRIWACVGKSGPGDALHERLEQLLARGIRVLERPERAVGDLAEVVRRDVGGHADRDADGAVDQQVGEARREHDRLLRLTVVVVLEVDGVFFDVAHHLERERGHLRLGVPGRGGALVAGRAEVALAECERVPQRPRLHEADEGVVDGRVAVRVVVAHDLADDARALGERLVGAEPAVVHARRSRGGARA